MKKATWIVVCLLATTGVSCVSDPADRDEAVALYQAPLGEGNESDVLPRGLTADEEARMALDPSRGSETAYPWECDPETYGFTPAASGDYRFPAEHSSTGGLLLGWPSWGCVLPELTELVRYGVEHTAVTVLVPREHQQGAEACLSRRGVTDEALAQIHWVNVDVDSVWIRDYGPEFLEGAEGDQVLVDMSYYPQLSNTCNNLVGRPGDDSAPSHFAALEELPVVRPQIRMEGGNFLSDGAGRCFRAQRVTDRVNCFSGWCHTAEEIDAVLGDFYGCEVVTMESMVGGVIDHIDMWMSIIGPSTILVGRFDPADDPANAAVLDRNAARLESLGYRVVRIPMPARYCMHAVPGCIGKESQVRSCSEPNTIRIWATYTNSIRVGDAMFVPVYRWVPEELEATIAAQEAETLATYQSELDLAFGPGAVTVIPIQSDVIIPCQGSFHCVTMTHE